MSGWEDQSRINYVIQEEEVEESIKEDASIETSQKLTNEKHEENPCDNKEQSETEGEVHKYVSEFYVSNPNEDYRHQISESQQAIPVSTEYYSLTISGTQTLNYPSI